MDTFIFGSKYQYAWCAVCFNFGLYSLVWSYICYHLLGTSCSIVFFSSLVLSFGAVYFLSTLALAIVQNAMAQYNHRINFCYHSNEKLKVHKVFLHKMYIKWINKYAAYTHSERCCFFRVLLFFLNERKKAIKQLYFMHMHFEKWTNDSNAKDW